MTAANRSLASKRALSLESLERRQLLAGIYQLTSLASTSGSFNSLGDLVAMNATGQVAFVGATSHGQGLWVSQAGQAPRNINPTFTDNPNRDFGRAAAINDTGLVTARDREGLAFLVRTWDSSQSDKRENVATAGVITAQDFGRYSALQTFTDINNRGDVAYIGLTADGQFRTVELKTHTASQSVRLDSIAVGAQPVPRPQLTADGAVLYRTERGVLQLARSERNRVPIVGPAQGFSQIGYASGINHDGSIVVFMGDRGHGLGVFAAIGQDNVRQIVLIAGEGKDGFANDGVDEAFDLTDAVRINDTLQPDGPIDLSGRRTATVVFEAKHHTLGRGVYSVQMSFMGDSAVEFNPTDPAFVSVSGATPVALVGQRLPGGSTTITDVEFWNGLNEVYGGQVALWASTSGGQQHVLLARPQEVLWLDFAPTDPNLLAKTLPNKALLNYFKITSNFHSLDTVLYNLQITDVAGLQDAIVNKVQSYFTAVGANVLVLGRVADQPPAFVPTTMQDVDGNTVKRSTYQQVWVGGSPSRVDYLGLAAPVYDEMGGPDFGLDYFNQIPDDLAVVFANQIIREAFKEPYDQINRAELVEAIASVIAHEAGHNYGLFHVGADDPAELMRDQGSVSRPQHFGTTAVTTTGIMGQAGVTQNSAARLRYTTGRSTTFSTASLAAPHPELLRYADERSKYQIRPKPGPGGGEGSSAEGTGDHGSSGEGSTIELLLAVISASQGDLAPSFFSLGSGSINELLNRPLQLRPGDQLAIAGMTDGHLDLIALPNDVPANEEVITEIDYWTLSANEDVHIPVTSGATEFTLYRRDYYTGTLTALGRFELATVPDLQVTLSGQPLPGGGQWNLGTVNFGSGPQQHPVTLTNRGSAALDVTAVTLTGANFSLTGFQPRHLEPGQQMTVQLQFSPTSVGKGQSATLRVETSQLPALVTQVKIDVERRPLIQLQNHSFDSQGRLTIVLSSNMPLKAADVQRTSLYGLSKASSEPWIAPLSVTYAAQGSGGQVTLVFAAAAASRAGDYSLQIDTQRIVATTGETAAAPQLHLLLDSREVPSIMRVGRSETVGAWEQLTDQQLGYSAPVAPVTGDFNGDGIADIAFASQATGQIVFYYGLATGGFAKPNAIDLPDRAPVSMVAYDWNGDGALDLLVNTQLQDPYFDASRKIYILLNDGRGNFRVPAEGIIPLVNASGTTMHVADVLPNPGPEIILDGPAMVRGDTSIYIIGQHAFLGYDELTSIVLPETIMVQAERIYTADFNGDGRLDILTSNAGFYLSNPGLSLALNSPTGFTTARDVEYPRFGGAGIPGLMDVNADGHMDIVVVHDYFRRTTGVMDGVLIERLLGDGTGNFTPAPSPQRLERRGVSLAGVRDVNGDGRMDLLLSAAAFQANPDQDPDAPLYDTPHSGIWTWVAQADGRFLPLTAQPIPYSGEYPTSFELMDLDGDGRPDLLFGSERGLHALRSRPDGVMEPLSTALPMWTSASMPINRGNFTHFATGDFNGDGLDDWVRFSAQLEIFQNRGLGRFEPTQTFWPDSFRQIGSVPAWVLTADVDNDGDLDILAGGHGLAVYTNTNGTFSQRHSWLSDHVYLSSASLADVNGDGKLDLVYTTSQSYSDQTEFGVLFGNGDGTFVFSINTLVTAPVAADYQAPILADFNGDGRIDILGARLDNNHQLTLLRGLGNGRFVEEPLLPRNVETYHKSLLYADLNNDSRSDIVLYGGGPRLDIYSRQLNGGLQYRQQVSLPDDAYRVLVGDFDSDGVPDLAVIYVERLGYPGDYYSIHRGLGDGTFATGEKIGLERTPLNAAVSQGYATLTIPVVTVANRPPIARNDTFTTRPGTAIQLSFLVNDDDPDGDTLVPAIVQGPTHGTLVHLDQHTPENLLDDLWEYRPNPGFVGEDSFVYLIADGRGGSQTATVHLQVTNVNVLPPTSLSLSHHRIWPFQSVQVAVGKPADTSSIQQMRIYRDVNNNGQVDVGVDALLLTIPGGSSWSTTLPTQSLAVGTHRLLVVTANSSGQLSPVLTTQLMVSWHNAARPTDTNGNGTTSPLDALFVINAINITGSQGLNYFQTSSPFVVFLDVNDDKMLTPLDALLVINTLNTQGEGEHFAATTSVALDAILGNSASNGASRLQWSMPHRREQLAQATDLLLAAWSDDDWHRWWGQPRRPRLHR